MCPNDIPYSKLSRNSQFVKKNGRKRLIMIQNPSIIPLQEILIGGEKVVKDLSNLLWGWDFILTDALGRSRGSITRSLEEICSKNGSYKKIHACWLGNSITNIISKNWVNHNGWVGHIKVKEDYVSCFYLTIFNHMYTST